MTDSPIPAFLRAIDALDLEAAVSLFEPTAVLTVLFGEAAVGEEQLRSALGQFLAELRATQHEVTSAWNPEPAVWIAELSATYELKDFSRRGPYKRALIVRGGKNLIAHLTIYGAHESPLSEEAHPYTSVRGPHGWLPTL